jgi:DNA-binding MarR family transcriptional regulator
MTATRARARGDARQPRGDALQTFTRAWKGALAAMRRMRSREIHGPDELSYAQYGLLFGLWDGSPRSSRELALAADVSPATATEMLDALAAAGLVDRTRSAEDKRIVLTTLTERGTALVEERRARFEPQWRAAFGGFSDEELATAARVLEAMRALFDRIDETER